MKISWLRMFLITVLVIPCCVQYSEAQNLLNLDGWTIGQGPSGIFSQNGATSENMREWGEGPGGKHVILWKAMPDGTLDPNGGWNTDYFSVNHTSMYRYTVWMKKTNSKDGTSYFGCQNVTHLDGTPNSNPYFWYGSLPELNKWYLLVCYIHGSGDVSQTNLGGVYDGITGLKVAECIDFKFSTSALNSSHRSFLFYDRNINDRQYFYAPRVDVVNGNEPSIESLLGLPGTGAAAAYFPGKVGIQTLDPGNYELAVNGKVRAKEVRVETAWSDFVFEENYPLLSLNAVEEFIGKNKHLPDVPSEREVLKNGVELGSVNSKLLQKIEELTLYLIQMNKELKQLKDENSKMKNKEVQSLNVHKHCQPIRIRF